jgi:predicted ATP-grasp superfamily ATP-dependent carboligase
MSIFSAAGDSTIAEWEEADDAAVEIARGIFEQAKKEGFAAVTPADGGARVVERFSPELSEIHFLHPIAGG